MFQTNRAWISIGVAIAMIAAAARLMLLPEEIAEIHNTDQVSNFSLVNPRPGSQDWPWWRGTDGRNVAPLGPVSRDQTDSSAGSWPVISSAPGRSTPIVWGDRLFLTCDDPNRDRISLECYRLENGRQVWRTDLCHREIPAIGENNAHCSATPICDGQFIYAVAATGGSLCLFCVDLKGRITWKSRVGSYSSDRGYGSSPAIFRSLVIVAADQKNQSYLAAIHRQTGEIVWRVKRQDGESHGTPIIANLCGRPQLLLSGRGAIVSYEPETGAVLWKFEWPIDRVANSITFDDERVYAAGNDPKPDLVCVNANGSGDVTDSHRVWRQSAVGCDVPSPVCHAGLLYTLSDDGLLTCLESATGKIEWRKQLSGHFSAAPLIAGELLICCSELGIVYFVRTGTSSASVEERSVSSPIIASPIVLGGTILIRTAGGLRRLTPPRLEPLAEKSDPLKRRF